MTAKGTPSPVPYGRQSIGEDDVDSVTEVLRSEWLTCGPTIDRFEEAFAGYTGTDEAVAVANGTAALHAAMHACGIGPGAEVIVPALTFVATANSAVYLGGVPVFADIKEDTFLLDPASAAERITSRTRAIVAVDYAGHPCDYEALRSLASEHGLVLIADACHALGGHYRDHPVGSLADLSTFSFHPVKNMTTGEGGMITTDNLEYAKQMRIFRNHGITTDHRSRAEQGTWRYEMTALGFNYRISDLQCALGISQLKKLDVWIARRQEIARRYDEAFASIPTIQPQKLASDVKHAYHLYVVRLDSDALGKTRDDTFTELRGAGIGVNVHYMPVYLHPFYRNTFSTAPGLCPVAESVCRDILSIPMFPSMTDAEVGRVIDAISGILKLHP